MPITNTNAIQHLVVKLILNILIVRAF